MEFIQNHEIRGRKIWIGSKNERSNGNNAFAAWKLSRKLKLLVYLT